MALNKDCIYYAGDKRDCPVSQKGKTYRLINEFGLGITIYDVDPCLIPDQNQQKCDYLYLIEKSKNQPKRAYFIELKGTQLSEAIKQLTNSIDILYSSIRGYSVCARIVGKRFTPDIKSRRVKLDEKLKRLGGDLKIVSNPELREAINNSSFDS